MTYHYTMCGLDYVYLRSGVREHNTEYGAGVSIEHADDLDHVIAGRVLLEHARLRGQEVRFLRSLTGLSQTEIANRLGVKRASVARWEGAPNTPIPGPADRLLRLIAARLVYATEKTDILQSLIDFLPEIDNVKPEKMIMSYLPDEVDHAEPMFPDESADNDSDGWKIAL